VLYDDRDERPGVKFKDADLIGLPLRVSVGERSLAKGEVEVKVRSTGQVIMLPVATASERICEILRDLAVK
jgi:prolyl-tRNA synthetase